MDKYISEINYDKLVEKALKNVMIDALKIVEKQGLPGDHHFYISFRTDCFTSFSFSHYIR